MIRLQLEYIGMIKRVRSKNNNKHTKDESFNWNDFFICPPERMRAFQSLVKWSTSLESNSIKFVTIYLEAFGIVLTIRYY